MMLQEFEDRTGYEPMPEEYSLIEEAYMEFHGHKDDFCKRWLKDKKSGHWDREYELRKKCSGLSKAVDELTELVTKYKTDLDKASEDRDYFHDIANRESAEKDKLARDLEEEKNRPHADIVINHKNGETDTWNVKTIRFVNRSDIQFITVEDMRGWMTSYRIDDVASFETSAD